MGKEVLVTRGVWTQVRAGDEPYHPRQNGGLMGLGSGGLGSKIGLGQVLLTG